MEKIVKCHSSVCSRKREEEKKKSSYYYFYEETVLNRVKTELRNETIHTKIKAK